MNHKIHCPWEFGEVPAFPGSRHGSKDGLGPEQKLAALTAFGCEVSWLLWPCLGGGGGRVYLLLGKLSRALIPVDDRVDANCIFWSSPPEGLSRALAASGSGHS